MDRDPRPRSVRSASSQRDASRRARRVVTALALSVGALGACEARKFPGAPDGGDGADGLLPGSPFAFRFGATADDDVEQIVTLAGGAGYVVVGTFAGTANFNPAGRSINRTATGLSDAYVARYDTAGTLKWVTTIGGPGADVGRGVAVTFDGRFVVTGGGYSGAMCPNAVALGSNSGGSDVFVAVLGDDGRCQRFMLVGSASNDEGRAIAAAADGSIFVTGAYSGQADFDPLGGVLPLAPTVAGDAGDVFVARYTSVLAPTWAIRVGSRGTDDVAALRLDAAENLVLAGTHGDSLRFTTPIGTLVPSMPMPSRGGSDLWVASFEPSGAFRWATRAGSPNNDRLGRHALAVDSLGGAWVGGNFVGTVVFGDGLGVPPIAVLGGGAGDALAWRVTLGGTTAAAFALGGVGSDLVSGVLAVGQDVVLTGSFQDTVDFSRGFNTRRLPAGSDAGFPAAGFFFARYGADGTMRWAHRMRPSVAPTGVPSANLAGAGALFWAAGRFTGAVNADPGLGTATLTSAGGSDAWMARFRADSGWIVRR